MYHHLHVQIRLSAKREEEIIIIFDEIRFHFLFPLGSFPLGVRIERTHSRCIIIFLTYVCIIKYYYRILYHKILKYNIKYYIIKY